MGRSLLLERIAQLRARLEGMAAPVGAPDSALPEAHPASGPPGATATLRRAGDVWTIDDGRTTLHLNDGRGVRLLAMLLSRPGQEIHSLDLVASVDGAAPAAGPAQSGGQETAGRFGVQGGTGPRLDAAAKAAYRARMLELSADIAEADARGDGAHAERARIELEFVARELELAVGIGGRDRDVSGSHAERARVNVTRAIRSTLKRIAGYDARLGRDLESSVRTGTFCVYEPDPSRPVRWAVHG
jgi:non-specific serine/threonine protein kinase